jgi:hypothetical protein
MIFEYNPEMVGELKNEDLEKEKVQNELSYEEKQYLVENWKNEVIDEYFTVNDSQIRNQELKAILSQSLMEDVAKLSEEWGIELDKSLPEEEYIEKLQTQINNLTRRTERDTHWDSWPKKMREDDGFNCVGAVLLGINAIKKREIESYYGNPWGHVVNIVRLSNEKWLYVDLRNNNVLEINPEEISLSGHRALKINDDNIDYKLIPIHDNSAVVGSIIGNLSGLEAEKGNEEGQTIYQNVKQKLFPEFGEIENTEEMKIEKERIESMQEAEKEAKDYLRGLPEERRDELFQEAIDRKELIRDSISKGSLLGEFSDELQEFVRLMILGLNGINKKEIKEEAISRFLNKIDKL